MKYDNLSNYLNAEGKDSVSISFAKLESILGFTLPKSAYTHRPWWGNGGHSHAAAWLDAGFLVDNVSLTNQVVVFRKGATAPTKWMKTPPNPTPAAKPAVHPPTTPDCSVCTGDVMRICGYPFQFLQEIMPKCDGNGRLIDYNPQNHDSGKDSKRLHPYGAGPFCRFSIRAEDVPGVYLWVVDGKIIYIGETVNLRQRFNVGYGIIQPANCYYGGQSTNCKMNKVVRSLFLQGKRVKLYFYHTKDNKCVELELLTHIKTPYNVKDNE